MKVDKELMTFLNIEKGREFSDISDFVDFLCDERDLSELGKKLNIVGAVSKFDSMDKFKNTLQLAKFTIEEEYGKLLLIYQKIDNESTFFYVFYDDRNNVPLFFTLGTKTGDIPETVTKYITYTKNITHLWIGPHIMKEINNELLTKYPDTKITYFSGKRMAYYKNTALLRPKTERLIQYTGRDAKEALEENEYYYGILPRVIEYELPTGLVFRLDSKGIVTLKRGKFREVFNILEEDVFGKILHIRSAISSSGYNITTITTKNGKIFERPIQKPWAIKLNDEIDFATANEAIKNLESDEWNFTIFNDLIKEGSVYFSVRIVDNDKNSKFEIISTGREINIYPIDEIDVGSAFRFYAFVLDNIDPAAKPILIQ